MDDFFGLNTKLIVAGLSGGSIYSYLFKKTRPRDLIGSLLVGGLSANYLSPLFSSFSGTPILVSAFVIGLAGMSICRRIITSASTWKPLDGSK